MIVIIATTSSAITRLWLLVPWLLLVAIDLDWQQVLVLPGIAIIPDLQEVVVTVGR